jgi:hypothetical protein
VRFLSGSLQQFLKSIAFAEKLLDGKHALKIYRKSCVAHAKSVFAMLDCLGLGEAPLKDCSNWSREDNAHARSKRQGMRRAVVLAITKGKLDIGSWEQIFYGEFDGRRGKRVLVKIIGE